MIPTHWPQCDALYDGDEAQASAAALELSQMMSADMIDTRSAMSALAYALTRPELEVQRQAVWAISMLADEGGHAELAMGSLLMQREHPDTEIREQVWIALGALAESRHPGTDTCLQQVARDAVDHADGFIRERAELMLKWLARPKPAK